MQLGGAPEYIRERVQIEDRGHDTPCWVWSGSKSEKGYGRAKVPGYGRWRIHRLTYTLFVGPIPDGLTIDHLCCVKECCNPAHLEAVTDEENRRRAGLTGADGKCVRGHDASERGSSGCRACARENAKTPEARARHAAYMKQWVRNQSPEARADRLARHKIYNRRWRERAEMRAQ